MKLVSLIVTLALFHSVAKADRECMATIKAGSGAVEVKDDNTTTLVKPGERFIAVKPWNPPDDPKWEVYLKSGTEGVIERSRMQLLPNEPVMKLNYQRWKQTWRKHPTGPVTPSDDEAWWAQKHGVDYYQTRMRASEDDRDALARFYKLSLFMDELASVM